MVSENGDDWHHLDTIWLSNGATSTPVRVEIRVELQEEHYES